jgi:hypothetical protein
MTIDKGMLITIGSWIVLIWFLFGFIASIGYIISNFKDSIGRDGIYRFTIMDLIETCFVFVLGIVSFIRVFEEILRFNLNTIWDKPLIKFKVKKEK